MPGSKQALPTTAACFGAVGGLHHAGLEAGVADDGGLLVARDPAHRDPCPEEGFVRGAEIVRVVFHLCQHGAGNVEEGEEFVVPLLSADVEEERAAGVGDVGHERAGEAGDKIGVDGAEAHLAGLGLRPQPIHGVEEPGELGAGEVRVEQEAGFAADHILVPVTLQLGAIVGGAAILPDDGAVGGLQRFGIPHRDGFALVGDADGGNILRLQPGFGERVANGGERAGPDLLKLVFHPAGLGVVLLKFLLADADDALIAVEHDGAGRGGALVDGEDGRGHGAVLVMIWAYRLQSAPGVSMRDNGTRAG